MNPPYTIHLHKKPHLSVKDLYAIAFSALLLFLCRLLLHHETVPSEDISYSSFRTSSRKFQVLSTEAISSFSRLV